MTKTEFKSPVFERPPVDEVVVSIQFDDLEKFNSVHFGRFHDLLKVRFPFAEDQTRIEPIAESGSQPLPGLALRFGTPVPARMWFKDDATNWVRLIQLQADRLATNWRRTEAAQAYPSYGVISKELREYFDSFVAFCDSQGIGPIRPNLCEVVYVDRIEPQAGETLQDLFEGALLGFSWGDVKSWGGVPELATMNRVFSLPKPDRGRVFVEASVGAKPESVQKRFLLYKTTARVVHDSGKPLDVFATLDAAHQGCIQAFLATTRPEFQRVRWGRKDK